MEGGVLERIFGLLLDLGVPGVIIIVLGYAVYKLYNRNQELHDTLRELGKEQVRSNEAMTNALTLLSTRLTDFFRES